MPSAPPFPCPAQPRLHLSSNQPPGPAPPRYRTEWLVVNSYAAKYLSLWGWGSRHPGPCSGWKFSLPSRPIRGPAPHGLHPMACTPVFSDVLLIQVFVSPKTPGTLPSVWVTEVTWRLTTFPTRRTPAENRTCRINVRLGGRLPRIRASAAPAQRHSRTRLTVQTGRAATSALLRPVVLHDDCGT